MPAKPSTAADAFLACHEAMRCDVLIQRVSKSDKEFHFQNWVGDRLTDAGLTHHSIGRNSYPDFSLVHHPEGYEVKGLQFPGRVADYDSNSRVPTGLHNGRTVYYVFGRYPVNSGEAEYPVLDLVICHGDFLNADQAYLHKNKSFRGFGSYGDLLVRDRKMYVAPTPFALTEGTDGQATLILPAGIPMDERLEKVGDLVRTEERDIIVGYSFDMRTNELAPQFAPNPLAGKKYHFAAYRAKGEGGIVRMKRAAQVDDQLLFGGDE